MTEQPQRHRLAILRNEMARDHLQWLEACEQVAHRITWDVIDLTAHDWWLRLCEDRYDGLLTQPTGWSSRMKALYDDRIARIERELHLPMIPGRSEIMIYENKRALASWLGAHAIPHPGTHVFDSPDEALRFLEGTALPLVAKTSMGAGGSGVRVLRSVEEAKKYVLATFHGQGAPRASGPKWKSPGFMLRALRKLSDPARLIERLRAYRSIRNDAQRDHVLFQAFVAHRFEWRVVRIGDSFFAHKKLVQGEKASGSLLKEYGDPPLALLEFVRELTQRHGFRSVAVDVFENPAGGYLVNEIQCVFGQSDPYQMMVNGEPGRYRHHQGAWHFEPGDFNRFGSYLLRLEYFLDLLDVRQVPAASSER